MIKNKVKTAAKYAVLSGMMAVGQISRADKPTTPLERKTPEKAQVTQNYVYQRNEAGIFGAPLLITGNQGMAMSLQLMNMEDLHISWGGKLVPSKVGKMTEMPASSKQIFLKAEASIPELKSAWERINKYMDAKGIKDFGAPSGQLPRAFQEDVNGTLTTWVVDKEAKTIQEFSFDKNGQEVSPDKVAAAKRFYRYHPDVVDFLAVKTPQNEYMAIEINQMTHPCPTFTYRDSKGINYICLGGAAFVADAKTINTYRGTIQQLRREQKLKEKAQKSR